MTYPSEIELQWFIPFHHGRLYEHCHRDKPLRADVQYNICTWIANQPTNATALFTIYI